MNCYRIILSPRSKKAGAGAFTLVEVLVMGAISTVVLAIIAVFTMFAARSFLALGNYNDLDNASRNALDRLSREIRQTSALTFYATNKLTFIDADGSPLTYQWVSPVGTTAGHLDRIKDSVTTTLLQQCDYLNFGVSQRNPSNDFSFYPAATNNLKTVKLIDMSWRCSRKILELKINTESVQTAKIVMRNH